MGFLDRVRKALGGGAVTEPGEGNVYWVYARCRRCGEPLVGRIDLRNEPSLSEDGETWIVRKGLIGSGQWRRDPESPMRCYQAVEVTLTFDAAKRAVIASEAIGGELISKEEYTALKRSAMTE